MNKAYNFMLKGVLAAFMVLPCLVADAANVVVLPLVNNYNADNELSQVYYNRALSVAKMGGHDIIDNSNIDALIEKNIPKDTLATEEALKNIAENSDADIVVGMELDKLDFSPLYLGREQFVKLELEGYAVCYNKLNNKFTKTRVYDDMQEEESIAVRRGWLEEKWSNNVSRQMRRAMNVKKFVFEKQRISKLK